MKLPCVLSLILAFFTAGLRAQTPGRVGEVETKWPGIHYVVYSVQRIPKDRVMFVLRITATAGAPKEGTPIEIKIPIPPDATKKDIARGLYAPLPFSLDGSLIMDEQTNRQYPTVKPDPTGNYLSSVIKCTLRPLQGETIAVQFELPPPPPDAAGRRPVQTATLLLFNASQPLSRIIIPPPPDPVATPAPSAAPPSSH